MYAGSITEIKAKRQVQKIESLSIVLVFGLHFFLKNESLQRRVRWGKARKVGKKSRMSRENFSIFFLSARLLLTLSVAYSITLRRMNMKRLFLVALTLFIAMFAFAQEKRVVLSEENLTFKANDDFTEVTITGVKSNGTDFSGKVVEFPSAIQGVPVTTIESCEIRGIAGIFIPEGVKTLGGAAFSGTSAKSVHLPESLETIGYRAFYESQLTSINFPTKLREIGGNAFYGCAKLEAVEIPKNCYIGYNAFSASGIKKLKLPAGRGLFEDDNQEVYGSFLDCDNLEKIEIPEGFIFISEYGRNGRRQPSGRRTRR